MIVPAYTDDGKLKPAGETVALKRRVFEGEMPGRGHAHGKGTPRPCARCQRPFKRTVKRRMLCAPCYGGANEALVRAT